MRADEALFVTPVALKLVEPKLPLCFIWKIYQVKKEKFFYVLAFIFKSVE